MLLHQCPLLLQTLVFRQIMFVIEEARSGGKGRQSASYSYKKVAKA